MRGVRQRVPCLRASDPLKHASPPARVSDRDGTTVMRQHARAHRGTQGTRPSRRHPAHVPSHHAWQLAIR